MEDSRPTPIQRPVAAAMALPQARSLTPVYIAAAVVYLLYIPEQFNPRLGGVYLPPYRIFLLLVGFYFVSIATRERLRLLFPDYCIGLTVIWIWLASYMTSGSALTAAVQGGAHAVDIGIAYYVARVAIRTPKDFRHFLIALAPGVGFSGFLVIQEAVMHTRYAQPLASAITGVPVRYRNDIRLGFLRGMGTFQHPIHAGIFLASFLPLYLMSSLRGWPKWVGLAGSVFAFFSMSSAGLLALLAGALLRGYDWLVEQFDQLNWRMMLAFISFTVTLIELVSKSGTYSVLIRYASLQTSSAYNRVLIWEFGTQNVAEHPWFGIGYADWDRPSWMHSDSFDHFWLIMALRFGIPASLFLIIATVAGVGMVAWRSRLFGNFDSKLMRGVAISLGVYALSAMSVSLWLAVLVWFFMLLGIAVSLGTAQPAAPRMAAPFVGRSPAGMPPQPLAPSAP